MRKRCDVIKIRPIKTEADYDDALARAWQLMDAPKDTPEADELGVLAALIEAYEDKHYPMNSPIRSKPSNFRWNSDGSRGRIWSR
jgi:HTH-type transcriptional regulator/antitoxin HigA